MASVNIVHPFEVYNGLRLPVFPKDGVVEAAEQTNYLLFDRMVAFNVQRGATIPLSAAKFYAGRSSTSSVSKRCGPS